MGRDGGNKCEYRVPTVQNKFTANMMRGWKWIAFPPSLPRPGRFRISWESVWRGGGVCEHLYVNTGCVHHPTWICIRVSAGASGHARGNSCDTANNTSATHVSLTTEQLPNPTLMGKAIIFQESTSTLFSFQFTLWESLSISGGKEKHEVMRWNEPRRRSTNYQIQHPNGTVTQCGKK